MEMAARLATILVAALCLLAASGAMGTIVSPELAMAEPVYAPAAVFALPRPAVACGSTECLAVWGDNRFGKRLFAARMGRNGEVLDPAGIQVTGALGDCLGVASDGAS